VSNVVQLDEQRWRRTRASGVFIFASKGLVLVELRGGRTLELTPAQARLWSASLATIADTAESEPDDA